MAPVTWAKTMQRLCIFITHAVYAHNGMYKGEFQHWESVAICAKCGKRFTATASSKWLANRQKREMLKEHTCTKHMFPVKN